MESPLKWLYEAEDGFIEVLALDRETSFSLAPEGAKLLDSRPLYEESWNRNGLSSGSFVHGPREPRLSAGNQPISYRRMTVAESRSR